MSVSAEEVEVLPPCDQELRFLHLSKKSPFRKGPRLLIMDPHTSNQKRLENSACKCKYKEILYTINYLGGSMGILL